MCQVLTVYQYSRVLQDTPGTPIRRHVSTKGSSKGLFSVGDLSPNSDSLVYVESELKPLSILPMGEYF